MSVQIQDNQVRETSGNGQPVHARTLPLGEENKDALPVKNPGAVIQAGDFYGALREIRAELVDLQGILDSIRRGKTIIPTYARYIDTTRVNLIELMAIINASEPPDELKNNIHTIRHLNNAWEQMQVSPLLSEPECEPKIQEQLHYLDLLDEQIHAFIYQIGVLTIPNQIREWLKITRPGFFIPFHEVFAEDLPRPEDRDQLLKKIARTPHLTPGGFVDSDNGRIYCYSTNPWRRMGSVALLLLALGAATGIVAASCTLMEGIEGWPLTPADLPKMLTAWAAVLIGMGAHILVGSAKRSKTQNGMPSVLMDMILIIDARFGEIVMKLMLGLIGLFGLVIISTSRLAGLNIFGSLLEQAPPATQTVAQDAVTAAQKALLAQVTPLNAFLVGYSLDSIIELFGTSIESASQVKSLIRKAS